MSLIFFYFQEEENLQREKLAKSLEENQKKIDEENKKMVRSKRSKVNDFESNFISGRREVKVN